MAEDMDNWGKGDLLIPGALPERADNYVTDDPEPWLRPFSGERAAHTGVNLYGSGYVFAARKKHEYVPFEEGEGEYCGFATFWFPDRTNHPPYICGESEASHPRY